MVYFISGLINFLTLSRLPPETYSEPYQWSKTKQFVKIINAYFRETLLLRCLTGLWKRLWLQLLIFYDGFWRRTYRYFINLFWSISNKPTPEPDVKMWLAFLCSIKLWVWSLSLPIPETLTVTLIFAKVKINSLHWIFWVIKYGYKACNLMSDWILVQGASMPNLLDEHKIIIFRKARPILKLSRKFLFILEFPIILF